MRTGSCVLALVAVFGFGFGFGCGSSDNQPQNDGGADGSDDGDVVTGDFTIEVAPPSLSIPLAGSGATTVTVARTGTVGEIVLSASNLPAGVTATFDPATLGDGVTSSSMTVSVATGAAVGVAQITITAAAGTLAHDVALSLTITTITVTGTVSSGASGVTVGLVGKASVTSGTGGTFTFTDVTPPYSLYTISNDVLGTKTVLYYEGLTRTDPIVAVAPGGIIASVGSSATVTGTLGNSVGAINRAIVWGDTDGETTSINASSQYTFTASWPGTDNTKTGTLHALEWTNKSSGLPNQIYYASTPIILLKNATNTVDTSLALATMATLTGMITPPPTFDLVEVQLHQQLGSNWAQLSQGFPGVIDASIPVLAAGKTTLYATSSSAGATSSLVHPGLDANTDVSFALLAPATLTTPAAAATGVSLTTDFTWTSPAGTVSAVRISTSGTTKVNYIVYTSATTTRIPNVTEAPLPTAQSFTWSVNGHAPHAGVDDVATANGAEGADATDFSGPRHAFTTSVSRTFTSQ